MKTRNVFIIGIIITFTLFLLFFYFNMRHTPSTDRQTRLPAIEQSPIQQTNPPARLLIPRLMAGEDNNTVFPVVEAYEYSPTTMRSEEVAREVANTLDGLMRLEATAIDKVSPRTTGGDYNPFRYMLQTAYENMDISDAFQHLAAESRYEILHYEVSDSAPNHFVFYLSCTTPYIADLLPVLTAGTEPKYVQEISRFAETGSAAEIAQMELKTLPISNDVVALTVIVENDVPIIYHPVSLNYGSRKPQYAFLWGGAVFSGMLDGDLLVENMLGHSFGVGKDKFLSVKSNAEVCEFIEASLDAAKKNEIDTISGLKLVDTEMEETIFINRIAPGLAMLSEEYPEVLDALFDRAASLEYSCRYFGFKRSSEGYIPYNTLLITFSVYDQDAGGRVYLHQLISWDSLDKTSRDIIAERVSDMLTSIFLGDQSMLMHRLNLKMHQG